ncbi:hypothetical protein G7054_g2862 [Neopestalotiopsis clavispora]|nr:hypothetical protein G7054_g2862 [Neopestalotiopsis clavispora]
MGDVRPAIAFSEHHQRFFNDMNQATAKGGLQIAPLVIGNLQGLKSLVGSTELAQESKSNVSSHLARFKLWSASLGAHRDTGTRALEYRLRDASSIRNQVLSLLKDLSSVIDQAHSSTWGQFDQPHNDSTYDEIEAYFLTVDASTQSPLDRSLAEIGHILDCLLRLSATISNPAPHDQFQSRVGARLSELFEPYDVRHVQEKFKDIDSSLAERLGRAVTMRRHYFRYRKEHHDKLSQGLGDDHDTRGDKTTIASSIPEQLKDAPGITSLLEDLHLDTQSEFSGTSTFPTSDAWREHNNSAHGHGQEVTDQELMILETGSRRHDLSKAIGTCPLCLIFHIEDSKHYSLHIGHHLELIALFSLPKIIGSNAADEGELGHDYEVKYHDGSSSSDEDLTISMQTDALRRLDILPNPQRGPETIHISSSSAQQEKTPDNILHAYETGRADLLLMERDLRNTPLRPFASNQSYNASVEPKKDSSVTARRSSEVWTSLLHGDKVHLVKEGNDELTTGDAQLHNGGRKQHKTDRKYASQESEGKLTSTAKARFSMPGAYPEAPSAYGVPQRPIPSAPGRPQTRPRPQTFKA